MKMDFQFSTEQLKEWRGNVLANSDCELNVKKAKNLIARAKRLTEHPPQILVLDDDAAILDLFRKLFDVKGYDGQYVNRARRAAELCRKEPIDLIICDLMMPDIDGYAFIRTIRRVPETREIPIIVYSAMDPRLAVPQLKGSRVDAFVQKPGDMKALLTRIQGFLEARVKARLESAEEE